MESNSQDPQATPTGQTGNNGQEQRFPFNGQLLTRAEIDAIKRQYAEEEAVYKKKRLEEWLQSEEGKLCLEFYRAFQEYKNYVQKNSPPWLAEGAKEDSAEHQLYKEGLRILREYEEERAEQRRKALKSAHLAARCEHHHADGTRCGSPRMRERRLCYKHELMQETRASKLELGLLEDAESIQVAIMKLQRAVIEGELEGKQITQLSSLMRLAAANVTRLRAGERISEEDDAGAK